MKITPNISPKRQSGMAVLLSLIILVVMTLAGIAVVRSVDSGALIAGNMAFKKSAAFAADIAAETARTWLQNNNALLTASIPGEGYSATAQIAADLTGNLTPEDPLDNINWPNSGGGLATQPVCLARDVTTGNQGCYVIHRLCQAEGSVDPSFCSVRTSDRGGNTYGSTRQMMQDQKGGFSGGATFAVYRITIRVDGPRNTVSFAQSYVVI